MDQDNPEKNANLPPLTGRLTKPSHEKAARILIKEIQKRYPNQILPPDSAAAITRDWAELIAEMGENKFSLKLKSALRTSEFFPSQKQILEAEEHHFGQKEKTQRCKRCEDTDGWLYVLVADHGQIRFTRPEVIRCPHTQQVKFTVRKERNGQWFNCEATACDMVP